MGEGDDHALGVDAGDGGGVFGVTADFAEANPHTMIALTKALIRAAMWLDANDNTNVAVQKLDTIVVTASRSADARLETIVVTAPRMTHRA